MKEKTALSSVDLDKIRTEFPIREQTVHGSPLVYLDNAATSQKPQFVIDEISRYYTTYNANIHRGAHYLASVATSAYEESRSFIANFIGAEKNHEIIFTSGTTAAINLVAHSLGKAVLKPGDEILISAMEHHSNIVPWQLACEYFGAALRVIPMSEKGELNLEAYESLLSEKTKIVAFVHVSNSLGTVNPAKQMISMAKKVGAYVLVDGAQSVPHMNIDVQELGCDFFVFSGHKTCGPTGIGVLYGKEAILEMMPPYQSGGEMIESVSFEKTTFNSLPFKFEAGTPHIEGGIVLGKALKYMSELGMDAIAHHEHELHQYQEQQLKEIEGLRIIGNAEQKASLSSFILNGIHPYDLGALLDQMGVAVRTGHHCTQPVMDFFGIPGTVRSSIAFYNSKADIDQFISSLKKAVSMLR